MVTAASATTRNNIAPRATTATVPKTKSGHEGADPSEPDAEAAAG